MDIRITVQPDARALARGIRHVSRRRLPRVRLLGVLLIVVGLLVVLTMGPVTWTAVGIVLVLGGTAYQALPALYVRRSVTNRARVLDEPRSYTFTERGVAMSSASQTSTMTWNAFARVTDTGEDLLLMPGRNQVIVVPRAAFTPDQFNELSVFLSGRGLTAG